MILSALRGRAATFGIYWTIRVKKVFPAIVTLGMVAGILLSFYLANTKQNTGFYVYMVFVALAFIYGLTFKEKTLWTSIIISGMSVSMFLYWLWVLNHWHGNTLVFPIVTLLVGLVAIVRKVKLKNELGFLIILAVDAVAVIVEIWMKAVI